MANILIYSSNPHVIDQCRVQLSQLHSVMIADSVSQSTTADVILIDSHLVNQNTDLLNQVRSKTKLLFSYWLSLARKPTNQRAYPGASGYFDPEEN